MGDHTECLEIDFNPHVISFIEIVRHFWDSHNPNRGTYKGRQYLSIFLYREEEQEKVLEEIKQSMEASTNSLIQTEVAPFHTFTIAEDRHQKYYLKRFKKATETLKNYFHSEEAFVESTLTARLNAFVKGYGKLATLKEEIHTWKLDEKEKQIVIKLLSDLRW
jgi:peptide-methionine (S)-S-oxide reductase